MMNRLAIAAAAVSMFAAVACGGSPDPTSDSSNAPVAADDQTGGTDTPPATPEPSAKPKPKAPPPPPAPAPPPAADPACGYFVFHHTEASTSYTPSVGVEISIELQPGNDGDVKSYADGAWYHMDPTNNCPYMEWKRLSFKCANHAWTLDASTSFTGMLLCGGESNDKQPGMSFVVK